MKEIKYENKFHTKLLLQESKKNRNLLSIEQLSDATYTYIISDLSRTGPSLVPNETQHKAT